MPVANVDLSALRHNLGLLRSRLAPGTRLLATVKANAYGHGAVPVATELERSGVRWLAVATAEEALELRAAGVAADILLLGPAHSRLAELADADIAFTVVDDHSLATLRRADTDKRMRLHLKVDTGMGRLGLGVEGAAALAREIDGDRRLVLEGIWTHFAAADDPRRAMTERQISEFERLLVSLRASDVQPPLVHAANSAGLLAYPEAHYDLVRPGIVLYGYPPSAHLAHIEPRLRPVMAITAPVTFVKRVAAGTPISYGASWRAARDTTIATVRYGYADGYPRVLANRGWARLHGRRVEVAGRVCMDQLMLDVGELEVSPGDRVTLLGPEGPTADDLGPLAHTVSYEILTSVAARVERTYLP